MAIERDIETLARQLAESRDTLFLGRGTSYPLALESANDAFTEARLLEYLLGHSYDDFGIRGLPSSIFVHGCAIGLSIPTRARTSLAACTANLVGHLILLDETNRSVLEKIGKQVFLELPNQTKMVPEIWT